MASSLRYSIIPLFYYLISIKVWEEIPAEENDKGLWVLIMSENRKGREGWPFSQRDNQYYMTVNGMPWQRRRRGPETKTSLAGHQNEIAFFVLFSFFVHSLKMANIGELPLRSLGDGPHPSSDSAKKLKFSLCLRPPNNVAKGNFFYGGVRTGCKEKHAGRAKFVVFSFTNWAHCRRRHRRLCRFSQNLSMCVNG